MIDATINWIFRSERLPKSVSEWVLPAAATAAVLIGINLVVKGTSKKDNGPPMVGSWIPWFGSTWKLNADPDAFMTKAMAKHPAGVFGVVDMGNKLYFVTSTKLINEVYKQPKIFAFSPLQVGWGRDVFSISDDVLYKSKAFPEQLVPHVKRMVTPQHMPDLVETFDAYLQELVAEVVLPPPGVSMSLADFFMPLVWKATGYMAYGKSFPADDLWSVFRGFDEMVYRVALGYPPLLAINFRRSREKVINILGTYLEGSSPSSELMGGMDRIAVAQGFGMRDRGAIQLSTLWPLCASLPWSSLWMLLLVLQQPGCAKKLIEELDSAGDRFSASAPDIAGPYYRNLTPFLRSSPALPLLASTYSETLRYATDTYSLRGVVPDEGAVLGGYTLKRGDTVVCYTRGVHMDDNKFPHPSEWTPDRFVADGEGGKGKEGAYKWMPFGGGTSLCGGRHFATLHTKVLMATLLKNFHFEVDHAKSTPIRLTGVNRAFGIRRPDGQLFVKITRINK